ncbi:response regulator [Bradyrhizobium ontarionense]|uniref:Response regulator n=1 Tax=Bradyrhizobium ontarionense TaxID=2898149 RepID=A0ABY3RPF8_9BRAD|nr:response regulator [Bradyrhizobium sp. A19]UFZ08547.1 response regulator [Bradyrhizobium sp. A19]
MLLVEDEPLILMDIELQLQGAGHNVISVRNADRAIEVLADRSVDVLLTDIDMQGSMDGLRLAAAVRERWPPIQIVVMSGKKRPTRDELPQRARFLEKPFHTHSLLEAVGQW